MHGIPSWLATCGLAACPDGASPLDGILPGHTGCRYRLLLDHVLGMPCGAQQHGVDLGVPGRYRAVQRFIGEDVEAELPEALKKVAADMAVPIADAEWALSRIMTRIRVVPLRMGDYLNPGIAAIRRCDPELPRAMRGDPDDLGTAALAEFLAPAVIISKDSVFNRFGLALPADRWTEEAARLLAAAGYDATLNDAAHAAEVGARLLFGGLTAVKNAAARSPKATITAVIVAGLAGWYCHRHGWITGNQLRAAGQRMASAAQPVAERIAAAARRNQARAALTIVEGQEPASLEERCARHLGRRKTATTPAELADSLSVRGTAVTAGAIHKVLAAHPAFTENGEGGFLLGRPVSIPAITATTGTKGPGQVSEPIRGASGTQFMTSRDGQPAVRSRVRHA
jgi:hypothetical protein